MAIQKSAECEIENRQKTKTNKKNNYDPISKGAKCNFREDETMKIQQNVFVRRTA